MFEHELISPLGLHDYLGIVLWEQDISDIQLLAQDMCLFRFDLGVYRDQDCEQQGLDRLERMGRAAAAAASSALPVHSTASLILASKLMWERYAEEDPETHRRDFRKILSHEYFHSYQGAHRLTVREARSGQEEEIDSPPVWFVEGTAEYAANIVAAKAGWIDWEYALLMRMKKIKQALREDPELSIRQNVTKADQRAIDPKHRHVATYDMGFWASAYAATLSSNDAVLKSLWDDFEKYGWQEVFRRNVGTSPEQFYKEFDDFLVVTLGPDCCSDEDHDKTKRSLTKVSTHGFLHSPTNWMGRRKPWLS